jgi:hypothetical protein
MFEFSLMEPHTPDYPGAELSRSTVARLQVLAGIAHEEFSSGVGKRVNELPDGMATWMWMM